MQLGKVAVERLQIAALDEDVIVATKHDGSEAVPLGLIKKVAAGGNRFGEFGQHRLDGWLDGKRRGHGVSFSQ